MKEWFFYVKSSRSYKFTKIRGLGISALTFFTQFLLKIPFPVDQITINVTLHFWGVVFAGRIDVWLVVLIETYLTVKERFLFVKSSKSYEFFKIVVEMGFLALTLFTQMVYKLLFPDDQFTYVTT